MAIRKVFRGERNCIEGAKILILGDLWTAPLFAYHFSQIGQPTEIWLSDDPPFAGPEPVYLGNGETREKAGTRRRAVSGKTVDCLHS